MTRQDVTGTSIYLTLKFIQYIIIFSNQLVNFLDSLSVLIKDIILLAYFF